VNGVGESKVRRYGEAMLATVRSHAGAARADADVIGRL
jgi:hypothetical protein